MPAPDVDLPNVVAKQSFLAQTASLAATTIFTPVAVGIFRVSCAVDANGTGVFSPMVTWTDVNRGQSAAVINYQNNAWTSGSGSIVFPSVAAAIQVSLFNPGGTFDLYVIVEQVF